ncbi:MAG: esterase-like activity of phytase family protein [Bryobacteraceae bacterium]|nr:esterase-like activity of phytase family protein [Bryobacteraceae bacterium]
MRLHPILPILLLASSVDAATLAGFASLPASTFVPGPTSGQFTGGGNGIATPFVNQQPVQGVSALLINSDGTYTAMSDNGFGAKGNSADALLGFFNLSIDFKTGMGGTGTVTVNSVTRLSDPDGAVNFTKVHELANYPSSAIPVDPAIVAGSLLTGGDFDLESFRRMPDGTYWFGEEFGPFLIHTDANGKVLDEPVALPGVQSPQSPFLGGGTANLPGSRGFEGMALGIDGKTLYPMLEGPLTTDTNRNRLIINEFDSTTGAYTGKQWFYRMENTFESGQAIGDFTAVNATQFLVIERDGGQGASALFKKVYLIDLSVIDADGFVQKTEIVDLLNILDPLDLDGDGNNTFRFPFVTIESVAIVNANTLLIANDNNFPFSNGRTPGVADNNEFILLTLPNSLRVVPEPSTWMLGLAGLGALALFRRRR